MFFRLMLVVMVLFMAGRVDAAGDAFDVRDLGEQGRVVYLVPGLASPGSVWDGLADELVEHGYRVRVLTLAGFAGQPPLDGDEFLPVVRRQLAAELARHEGQAPLIVGHSLGAFLAYWLAATEVDRLAGVVAIDGLPYLGALGNPEATPDSQRAQAEQLARFMASLTPEQYDQQNRMALSGMITAANDVERMADAGGQSDPASVGRAVAEMLTTDLRPMMRDIRVPVILIQAADSGATEGTRQAFARQIAEIPDHRHLVADRGRHFVQLDDPRFVARAVLELLEEIGHD
jgi:N-formylmaleamate deformylase